MARGDQVRLTTTRLLRLGAVALAAVLALSITACREEVEKEVTLSPRPLSLPPGSLTIAYSPEKEDLFQKLVLEFNLSRPPDTPPIHAVRRDVADMLDDAVDGKIGAISPDSSIWLVQLDRMWQRRNPEASTLIGAMTRFALSPIVIAMWESIAREMGYPKVSLGWENLMQRAMADPDFKWSHPSATVASGMLTVTAVLYAAAGKLTDLTREDLEAKVTREYVKTIESTVERYRGESEDRVVIRILAEGGYPLDAFVAQEQLVIYFNRNTTRENLVAIYPKEGTFYMDHPLVLLDGPWVTKEQQRAFHSFAEFVTDPEQQHMVLREGYRPGVLRVSLDGDDSLIQPDYKVDPTEPKKLLKVPPAGVVEVIRELWRLIKKPANIYLLADVSGSMGGEKLSNAKRALLSFIDQVKGERDRVALVTFSSDIDEIKILLKLKQFRKSFKVSIRELRAAGGTRLYDAVWYAYERLQEQSDPARINAMVVMTDGENTEGSLSLEDIRSKISRADAPVLIFSVAYGEDADWDILQQIARLGSGYAYPSDPETIEKLYGLISKFF